MSASIQTTKLKKFKSPQNIDGKIILNDDVKQTAPNTSAVLVSTSKDATHYKTDHPNMGLALIFNHTHVDGENLRLGIEKDQARLEQILKLYGFTVIPHNDLKYDQIMATLDRVSKEDHTDNNCILVIVMSHGMSQNICAQSLFEPFLGRNCETLICKPKLFFIQECRDKSVETGIPITTDTSTDADACKGSDQADDILVSYTIPTSADTFAFYSTIEGQIANLNQGTGSWFIQSIANALDKYSTDKEGVSLYDFATEINRKVGLEFVSFNPETAENHNRKAMPSFASTLTKTFILKPKLESDNHT